MKKIAKYFVMFAAALAGLTSCETYGEPNPGESAIGETLSGFWVGGTLTDVDANAVIGTNLQMNTYETADKAPDQMWVWFNYSKYGFRMKAKVDVSTLAILETAGKSTLPVGGVLYDCKIISGKVEKNATTTASGGKADRITIVFTNEAPDVKGKTLQYVGYRDTLWSEDYE